MADPRQALQKDLLRGPGESQRDQIAAAAWDAAEYAALAVFLPPAVFCAFPLMAVLEGDLPGPLTLAAFALAALVLLAWVLARLWRVLARARGLALGYEAGVATAQELDALRHLGYCVFHGVPAEGFEADIDPRGGRPGRRVRGGDGGAAWPRRTAQASPPKSPTTASGCSFPAGQETLPLGRAMAQAEWLCGWLANALNEPVAVRALLVLPGWSVKRTAVSGIPVLAARRINAYFGRMRRAAGDERNPWSIASPRQLDRHCRVIAVVAARAPRRAAGEEAAEAPATPAMLRKRAVAEARSSA
jgi:hypothetical protein